MDFIEEYKSHILFIPGIFPDDCLTDCEIKNYGNTVDLSTIVPEKIGELGDSDLDDNLNNNLDMCQLNDIDNEFSNYDFADENNRLKLDDLMDNKFENTRNNKNIIYDNIPKYFINRDSWIKSTNLSCCYCHDFIINVPIPIPISLQKILIPENNGEEIFISVTHKNVKNASVSNIEGDTSEHSEMSRYIESTDDNLLYSSQIFKESKAYLIHTCLCCDVVCAGNYIRKIDDNKITNKRESIRMLLLIYEEIMTKHIEDIPDKDLWINMEQYCGNNGMKRENYRKKNAFKEIEFNKNLNYDMNKK